MTRAFTVALTTSIRRVTSEPASMAVSIGFYVLVVAVLSGLWRIAVGANDGMIAGYSAVAITWYIVATEACTVPLNARIIEQTGDEIASGAVAVELLRPVPMVVVRVAAELGYTLPRLAVCLSAGGIFATVVAGGPPSTTALVLAIPSTVLAVTLNIVLQHAFAAISFWIRDSRSTWFVYQKVVFLMGGMLIPLEALPDSMATIARFLPFMAMAYAPGRLIAGHVEPLLLVVQAGWLAFAVVVASSVFTRGERRLQVIGG